MGSAFSFDKQNINIRRLGQSDIRLESKAHGEGTMEKVRQKEVQRFQDDLLGLNAHGIFVSLHSGIVGKGEVELEQLANGKFAVFLSNNNYDISIIHDFVQLFYRLDQICNVKQGSEEDVSIKVSPETMRRVQLYLKDFTGKVSTIKSHLKEGLSVLNEMTFDMIERALMGKMSVVASPSTPPESAAES